MLVPKVGGPAFRSLELIYKDGIVHRLLILAVDMWSGETSRPLGLTGQIAEPSEPHLKQVEDV